ncbi:MAG: hypothetical protein KDB14_10060 [Planctomycetales bacterium]|nr:hypothetical protein [Planctomycetales bacterium]
MSLTRIVRLVFAACSLLAGLNIHRALPAAEPLSLVADFEGASVDAVRIDQTKRVIEFMPGGEPARGWPCWWYFRVDGVQPGETLTLKLKGSSATVSREAAAGSTTSMVRPLSSVWAMPKQATFSHDQKAWRHTDVGQRDGEWMVYTLPAQAESVYVAWGPPFTPTMASDLVRKLAENSPHATARELCRSRGGRSVPMLHVREGDRTDEQRFGVWVQARQHAWESGSSWVARGFAEWLLSADADAAWLRQHAEVFLVPIMDIDNTATGNGGKDALPHDHNRDWSDQPVWTETIAAQTRVSELIEAGRMDVFLDLHNPAPGDPSFFYVLDDELLPEPMVGLRDRFIEKSYARISRIKPLVPMSNKPKTTGPKYHPLWKNISANWVALHGNPHTVSLCLETIWNYQNSTTDGYRAVGANLAQATRDYLGERPPRK